MEEFELKYNGKVHNVKYKKKKAIRELKFD